MSQTFCKAYIKLSISTYKSLPYFSLPKPPPSMKKFLLQAMLLLFAAVPIFVSAQDIDEHSAEYQWGERNALWVILAVIVIIILVVRAVRKKKKGP